MDTLGILGIIINPIVAFVSWLAGTRSRRNSVYQELLSTIKTLTEQNSELQAKVVQLQDEVIEVRKENAELKAGQTAMTRQMDELKAENNNLQSKITQLQEEVIEVRKENAELKELVTQNK